MIIREKPGILALLFAVRGSVLPHIAPQLLFFGLFAAAVVGIDRYLVTLPHVQAAPLAVFGVALSLFLGFRNNAAYDRWWEARRLWGALLADARSIAREAEIFLADPQDRRRLLTATRAFLHQHRCALRGQPNDEAALRDAPADPSPDATLDAMAEQLADALRNGRMDGFGARTLSTRLSTIALRLFAADLPDELALLPPPSLRAARADGLAYPALCRHRRLHLLRPCRGDRGTRPPLRPDRQRPAA
jgi:putative membrane protein